MALAILRPSRVPGPAGAVHFTADLGSNRFFQVAVGDDAVDNSGGVPLLGAPQYNGPIVGPLPESSLGRTEFDIPVGRFDRTHRVVQLTSFRTRAGAGPAYSDLVRVGVAPPARDDLPPLAFSLRDEMDPYTSDPAFGAPAAWRRAAPMAYREVQPMSGAMFWGSLLPMLSGLAAKILPALTGGGGSPLGAIGSLLGGAGSPLGALGSLLGGGAGSTGGGKGAETAVAPPSLSSLVKPETVQLIMQLLQQLQNPAGVAGAPAGANTKSLAQAAPEYSHAAIAPLLAALPALMPLLEKVLTPETIKAVLDHTDPTKIIGAVKETVTEVGKLGLEHDKQEMEHLRALNPMGVHGAVDDLLKDMGLSASLAVADAEESGGPAYRRVESVELSFANVSPVMIHGRSRVCYRAGDEIAFPLDLKTPRPVANARLSLVVKDPASRKVLVRKQFTVPQAAAGRLATRVALGKNDIAPLKSGEEYLVCAYLIWPNARKKPIGTSRSQLITVLDEYIFDRVEDGKVVPLNDVSKYRPFWHKVWQGSFSKELFKVDFEGKYYYVLDPSQTVNTPIETTTTYGKDEGHVKRGRLQSGMNTTIGALNALLPQLSTGKSLGEAQLSALASSDFVTRFNCAARFSATLSGKAGMSGAIWIYPEVRLNELVLYRAASTDADGHVRELTEERVHFPMPVTIHVIGARTTR